MEYPLRIPKAITEAARISGVVLVYGGAVDAMHFGGALTNEFCCREGTEILVDSKGHVPEFDEIYAEGDAAELAAFLASQPNAKTIKAIWAPAEPSGASWGYEISIPHATFDVMKGGGIYCRAIAFNLTDLEAPKVQHLPSDDTEGGAI